MNTSTHPSKEAVRQWLQQQIAQHRPPPSPREIRQDLHWGNQQNLLRVKCPKL